MRELFPPSRGHERRQFRAGVGQVLGHAHTAAVPGEALSQAGGLCRGVHSPPDLLGRQPEDRRLRVQLLLGGPDGLQRFCCLLPNVERHSLAFLVGLGPVQLQEGGPVVAKLHVCPGEQMSL